MLVLSKRVKTIQPGCFSERSLNLDSEPIVVRRLFVVVFAFVLFFSLRARPGIIPTLAPAPAPLRGKYLASELVTQHRFM